MTFFFIYTEQEAGYFKAWRLSADNITLAKKEFSKVSKSKKLIDFGGREIPIKYITLVQEIKP